MKTLAPYLILGIILLVGMRLIGFTTDIGVIDRAVTALLAAVGMD